MRLVQGVGINDAGYAVARRVEGVQIICPYYRKWANMLKRAHNQKYKLSNPSYSDVRVCTEWLTFSVFREWMETQDWEGMELDKDVIKPGNKEYGPDTCCFITGALNKLLTYSSATRGAHPMGVLKAKSTGRFNAACCVDGKTKSLGGFETQEEASSAYRMFKANLIREAGLVQTNTRIAKGLEVHATLMEDGHYG